LKREKGAQRHRRLLPDVIDKNGKLVEAGEERRLLAVAGPELQRLIIGALTAVADAANCSHCNGATSI